MLMQLMSTPPDRLRIIVSGECCSSFVVDLCYGKDAECNLVRLGELRWKRNVESTAIS